MMAGFNMPDGLSETTPVAPWNQPDPWEGRTCGECRHSVPCLMLDGSTRLVCAPPLTGDAMEVDGRAEACEGFEAP